ncbi:permease prefix domain 1-containing protein [Microbacterium sp. X-17]|uniref:permease prefix domain 1-containing protein n=1 Tax=Microbacterium sp. X-17 TaxID=3144404 RepID=UPI0031F517BD
MNTDLHRLLDEAFAGVEMTPDAQDLKEEIRANLIARVAELEASGRSSSEAAREAVAELGDVRDLLAEPDAATRAPGGDPFAAAQARHHVRPKPAYVVRTVIASVVAVAGLLLAALGATGVLPVPLGVTILFLGIGATGVAWIVGDALVQETTTNHPMSSLRAGGFFLATFLVIYGAGFAGLVALSALPVWGIVFAALGVVVGTVLYAWLGATQTNRRKAWVRELTRTMPPNRFEQEPETAARFGIYTAVIWVVTFAVIVVLVFTVGWWWAPLAFLGGFALMMLILARMMFAPSR